MKQELDEFPCDNCGQYHNQTQAIVEQIGERLLLFCSIECRNKYMRG